MLEFKPIRLSDGEAVREALAESGYDGCEYSFGNLFCWRDVYKNEVCFHKNTLFIKNQNGYYFPAGQVDTENALFLITEHAKNNGKPIKFATVPKQKLGELTSLSEGKASSPRDLFDYVYTRESLASLRGKKLHAKRTNAARFYEFCGGDFTYEPLTEYNIEECKTLSFNWCQENNVDIGNQKDSCAVDEGLENFFALGFVGGMLRAFGKPVAFTYGERLNHDTFVSHVEKAMSAIQGTYAAINTEFAQNALDGYVYINREDDTGSENLRKAKLSYDPIKMIEKFTFEVKG
ncbi:MAG: phosphatidylglycerol lysyltransferase domain-containing protein [Oscillospiraceae bacterium]|jgi:hypothetical protein|nr:phosphatidylglycerol lysyltransferase domain-containing protein [Oscillospiraceae bacterium]